MKTLATTTIKRRINILLQESREFIRNQQQLMKKLQDRCPHEKTQREHQTVYCSTCDKVMNVK